MSNSTEGFWAWINPRRKSPRIQVIEIEKGVPTDVDSAAIASLEGHPGITALINRLRLQRAYLESRLIRERHETLRDADVLQLGIYWSRFVELQIRDALGKANHHKVVPLAPSEVEEFEKARRAIEGVATTSSGN